MFSPACFPEAQFPLQLDIIFPSYYHYRVFVLRVNLLWQRIDKLDIVSFNQTHLHSSGWMSLVAWQLHYILQTL